MSLVVDASVAAKWFFQEAKWEAARTLANQSQLLAPELILAEVGNAAWKRCRRAELSPADAIAIVGDLQKAFERLIPVSALATDAMRISAALSHPIYDCFYLALAEREHVPIVSADRRLQAAALRLGTVQFRLL
jgi:predicted nucleic acid-binding protein